MTSNIERDNYICQDYQDGKQLHELARCYGLSEKRVSQILVENNIPRRPRTLRNKKSLSRTHTRIGVHLYTFRHKMDVGVTDAANDLGWSVIKLRKVEQGTTEIELLDLLDIAAYTQTKIGNILEDNDG